MAKPISNVNGNVTSGTSIPKTTKRKRNSSFQANKNKHGTRHFSVGSENTLHSSNGSVVTKRQRVEMRMRLNFSKLRLQICNKAFKTGYALMSSFLLYPCFLAYLWGFTEIQKSSDLKSWAPLYALLLGPLRLAFQTMGEVTLARAVARADQSKEDESIARVGGAWTLALGVS